MCLSRKEFADNFEEFSAWNQKWKRYCCIENHHPESEVFDSILGIKPITSAPVWCGLVMCKHVSIDQTVMWVKAGKGLPIGIAWAQMTAKTPQRPYREVLAEERGLWTTKQILARQQIGLSVDAPAGIAEPAAVEDDVPF